MSCHSPLRADRPGAKLLFKVLHSVKSVRQTQAAGALYLLLAYSFYCFWGALCVIVAKSSALKNVSNRENLRPHFNANSPAKEQKALSSIKMTYSPDEKGALSAISPVPVTALKEHVSDATPVPLALNSSVDSSGINDSQVDLITNMLAKVDLNGSRNTEAVGTEKKNAVERSAPPQSSDDVESLKNVSLEEIIHALSADISAVAAEMGRQVSDDEEHVNARSYIEEESSMSMYIGKPFHDIQQDSSDSAGEDEDDYCEDSDLSRTMSSTVKPNDETPTKDTFMSDRVEIVDTFECPNCSHESLLTVRAECVSFDDVIAAGAAGAAGACLCWPCLPTILPKSRHNCVGTHVRQVGGGHFDDDSAEIFIVSPDHLHPHKTQNDRHLLQGLYNALKNALLCMIRAGSNDRCPALEQKEPRRPRRTKGG